MKHKLRPTARAEFRVIEPVEFQDKLAEKCWNFVTEKIAEIPSPLANRRNLVVVVKVCVDMWVVGHLILVLP